MVPHCLTNYLDQTLNSSKCAQAWGDLPRHSQAEQEVGLSKTAECLLKPTKKLGVPRLLHALGSSKNCTGKKKNPLITWSLALESQHTKTLMTIQWKVYKRLQNRVFIKKEWSQNYSTAPSARRGTSKARHRARQTLGHLLPVRTFNAGYLQISLPLVPQPPFPSLTVLSYTSSCKLFVSCHTEQFLISVTQTQRSGIGIKLTFWTLKIGSYRPLFTSAVST